MYGVRLIKTGFMEYRALQYKYVTLLAKTSTLCIDRSLISDRQREKD